MRALKSSLRAKEGEKKGPGTGPNTILESCVFSFLQAVVHGSSHRQLAREAAAQGIVLLQNTEARLLPLSPTAHQTIAVIGPLANRTDVFLGDCMSRPKARTQCALFRSLTKRQAQIPYRKWVRKRTIA